MYIESEAKLPVASTVPKETKPAKQKKPRASPQVENEAINGSASITLPPDAPVWKVVGGGTSDGILVRRGSDLSSPKQKDRLSTGSIVYELAREMQIGAGGENNDRLQYCLLEGQGPLTGWVSRYLHSKPLLTQHKLSVESLRVSEECKRLLSRDSGNENFEADDDFREDEVKINRGGATVGWPASRAADQIEIEELSAFERFEREKMEELHERLQAYGILDGRHGKKLQELKRLHERVDRNLPLMGTWEYGKNSKRYHIRRLKDGTLTWEGPHESHGTVFCELEEGRDWLHGATVSSSNKVVGAIRLQYVRALDQVISQFQGTESFVWNPELQARRVSQEQRRLPPSRHPASIGNAHIFDDYLKSGEARDDTDESYGWQFWDSLSIISEGLRVQHAAEVPLERWAHSWARTMAFAQITLGLAGIPMHHGREQQPFLIWVLGASNEIEVSLAERGFFRDANFIDRAATEVVLIGKSLRNLMITEPVNGQSAGRQAAWQPHTRLKKDDAATYEVISQRAMVRSDPSSSDKIGVLFKGMEVRGREEDGWLRLDEASAKLMDNCHSQGPFWVRIGGQSGPHGFPECLRRKNQKTYVGGSSTPTSGDLLVVRSVDYALLKAERQPHLVVVFMSSADRVHKDGEDEPLEVYKNCIPWAAQDCVNDDVPIVFTTRFEPPEDMIQRLVRDLKSRLLSTAIRCPFSALAGDPGVKYDDNGWFFMVSGRGAIRSAMRSQALDEEEEDCQMEPAPEKAPVIFWGIVDLKYNSRRPILDRTHVLETGDGRISKFSGHGAPILEKFNSRYKIEDQGTVLQTYEFISRDKKLTHDLFELNGYGHIIPEQVCLPRCYTPSLAQKISSSLHVQGSDMVVLKLCNRSRGAGCIFVSADELDSVLREILVPPSDVESWLRPQIKLIEATTATNFGFDRDSHQEQVRHWWSNESPSFVAERCSTSTPIIRTAKAYDGTMRVAFALRSKRPRPANEATVTLSPEDIQVDWLGGYWKLPTCDATSSKIRERIISAAKSGTAPVDTPVLHEVYAALGGAIQQLFGAAEITSSGLREQYKDQQELAIYFAARLAMFATHGSRALEPVKSLMADGRRLRPGECKDQVQSYLHRALGVSKLKVLASTHTSAESWAEARKCFEKSAEFLPTNASALFLCGMAALEAAELMDAVDMMNRSLLLDPDFRAPYINIGMAYLRLAVLAEQSGDKKLARKNYCYAVEVSEACLDRHSQTPQAHYHKGVATCQLALKYCVTNPEAFEDLRSRAVRSFKEARSSSAGQQRRQDSVEAAAGEQTRKRQPPWLHVDDLMVEAMTAPSVDACTEPNEPMELPLSIGWRISHWRT